MTPDPRSKLHLVFDDSAAGGVRQALERIGVRELVIGLPDDLSVGPIDDAAPRARGTAIEDLLGSEYEEVVHFAELFWSEAMSPATLPVAWICRNRASEYAGYLEFLRRIGDASFRVVDVTAVEIPSLIPGREASVPSSLDILRPEQIITAGLLERQTTVSPDQIEADRRTWRKLQAENAPFRIVDATDLLSAPVTVFDETVIACATADWEKAARVVGRSMEALLAAPFSPCPSDWVLWARTRALAEAGRLEISGNGVEMRGSFVRRR